MNHAPRTPLVLSLLACLPLCAASAGAQTLLAVATPPAATLSAATASFSSSAAPTTAAPVAALPEAPQPVAALPEAPRPGNPTTVQTAPRYAKYIAAGETAQSITARDKVAIGLRDSVSLTSIVGWFVVSGYEQATNGSPNYGTDRGAYGQRLGAAAARDVSEGLLTDSVFAPILHQDPRYYVEGPSHNFFQRLVYAGTRPLITRTDGGHSTINASMILGNAAGSALSYIYYPSINRNFTDTARTFGSSFGGDALGFVFSEFSSDLIGIVHHHHS